MENNKEIPSSVIIDEIGEEDWELGAVDYGQEELVPNGDWTPYDVTNERQKRGFESMACTNFSSNTMIEIYFNYLIKNKKISVGNLQWLKDNNYFDENNYINFSDRFDAVVSGTSTNGNSLKRVAQAKHKYGLIPESMHPWVDRKQEYFDERYVTQEMYEMGLEWLRRFPINYELIRERHELKAQKTFPLAGACYGWNGKSNGIFYKVNNQINHAIGKLKIAYNHNDIHLIKDSYLEFIKKLAFNYKFLSYSVKYIIRELTTEKPINKDMLKTIKFNNSSKIYVVTPANDKKLVWIGDVDKDGKEKDAFPDYKFFIEHGIIAPYEELSDSLYASYKILGGMMKVDFYSDPDKNPFGIEIFKKLARFFEGSKKK